MKKPTDLVVAETRRELLQTLNSAGLPISVLALIVGDVYNVLKAGERSSIEKWKTDLAGDESKTAKMPK